MNSEKEIKRLEEALILSLELNTLLTNYIDQLIKSGSATAPPKDEARFEKSQNKIKKLRKLLHKKVEIIFINPNPSHRPGIMTNISHQHQHQQDQIYFAAPSQSYAEEPEDLTSDDEEYDSDEDSDSMSMDMSSNNEGSNQGDDNSSINNEAGGEDGPGPSTASNSNFPPPSSTTTTAMIEIEIPLISQFIHDNLLVDNELNLITTTASNLPVEVLVQIDQQSTDNRIEKLDDNGDTSANANANVIKKTSFPCGSCEHVFSTELSLKNHTRVHRPAVVQELPDIESDDEDLHLKKAPDKPSQKEYKCGECQKLFKKGQYLNRHLKTHQSQKLFLCSDCGASFKRKDCLVLHIRGHTGERPYKCTECSSSFFRLQALKQHRSVHTKEKSFVCEICSASYTLNANLLGHMKIKHFGVVRKSKKKIDQVHTTTNTIEAQAK